MLWVRFTLRYYRNDLNILIFYVYNDRPNYHDLISGNGIIKYNTNLTINVFFFFIYIYNLCYLQRLNNNIKVSNSIENEIRYFFLTISSIIIVGVMK